MDQALEIVGLVPAAGRADRLSPLPISKELFPIAFDTSVDPELPHLRLVSHYLFEKLRLGDAQKTYLVIREGKWDIPNYFLDGAGVGLNLAYIVTAQTPGVSFTVDRAYPFIKNDLVLFGYPDILFQPPDAFKQLVDRLRAVSADAVIGCFDLFPGQLTDRASWRQDGRITKLDVRSTGPDGVPGWVIAVWTPVFTEYLHKYLANLASKNPVGKPLPEIFLGHIFQAALGEGLHVNRVYFSRQNFWDIGSPEGLQKALEDKERWI